MEIDELQTYLIGLKFYTTNSWPYFGPDVNGIESTFQSQIPGALEALLVGLPFYILPLPEAPFIFLNLMTAAGVMLLGWYLYRRIPGLSFVWLSLWIAVVPWSLHEATFILNPAYIFLPSVLFFIGFMEATPSFRSGLAPLSWSNALMGLSLFWIMQFHFSYIYLIPLTAFSLLFQLKQTRKSQCVFFFILGSLAPLAFAIPTYLKFGLSSNNVASGFAVPFDWGNVKEFWTILARFLSLVSFEIPRFIGENNHQRFAFLENHPLLLGPGAMLWILGLLQPFVLAAIWFRELRLRFRWMFWILFLGLCVLLSISDMGEVVKTLSLTLGIMALILTLGLWLGRFQPEKIGPQWQGLNLLLFALFAMVYTSFWFTIKMPLSHIYFILFPFIMAYSCYCWVLFVNEKYGRVLAKVIVVFGIIFQLDYALTLKDQYSIYPQRPLVVKAIQEKNYHLMGERRPGSRY